MFGIMTNNKKQSLYEFVIEASELIELDEPKIENWCLKKLCEHIENNSKITKLYGGCRTPTKTTSFSKKLTVHRDKSILVIEAT